MNPHQPASGGEASALRRRRARSLLPFLGQEARDQALDDLAQRAFPRLDFFLYTLLSAFLISLSIVFSAPVLLVAGLAFAPLLSPLTGTALGLVTGSMRFAARNLAALALAWILAFIAAWAGAYLFSFLPGRGEALFVRDVFTAFVVVGAAAALTWRFLRGASDSWIPNLVVSFGFLYPICAAAGYAATGASADALSECMTWGIFVCLALLASIGMHWAMGFRPSGRNLQAYIGMAAAGAAGLALILAWIDTAPPATHPAGTPEPVLLPTASYTLTLRPTLTGTATISPIPSSTPPPSPTLTPTETPAPALVHGTGGQGVYLRDAPGLAGKKIASLQEGELVEVLGPPVDKDDTQWVPVRTSSGIEGWMALEFCSTLTPTSTRA
jgi:hypothetical protein